MNVEGLAALSLAGCALVFALQNDPTMHIVALALLASALALAAVAI